MIPSNQQEDRPQPEREPATELSPEEQAVLARIRKQAKPRRRKPHWKHLAAGSTAFLWWLVPGW